MFYIEAYAVVDGEIDEEHEFLSWDDLDTWVERVKKDAKADGKPTQIYTIVHEHSPSEEECACVQFLSDHHPYWDSEVEET